MRSRPGELPYILLCVSLSLSIGLLDEMLVIGDVMCCDWANMVLKWLVGRSVSLSLCHFMAVWESWFAADELFCIVLDQFVLSVWLKAQDSHSSFLPRP